MIGLENAKRLKELGVYPYGTGDTGSDIKHTLSQLLEEVEKRGWFWDVWHDCTGCGIDVWTHEIEKAKWNTTADTCEDAVALALIEILEGEK